MSSNNLGALTLNLVADLGQYTVPLEKAERLTQRAMKAMGISIDEFGNYTDKAMKKAVESTQQLDAQFEKLSDNLQREVALYGDTSRAAQMRYDLEKGALQNLDAAQKASLMEMTRRLSAMESANAAFREQAAIMKQLDASHDQLAASMQREIELYGQTTRVAQLRYDLEKGALKGLTDQQKYSLTSRASILDAMDKEAAKTRELAAASQKLDAQHDQLQESMLAQLATYGQVTRVAKLRYDMERGALRGLTEAQKQSSLQLAAQLDSLDKAAQGSMRGIRGMATGIGYQMQDIAVQLQMGTNPLMVFAQQGSQIASLFGPGGAVVGAVIAIGGAIAGALLPSLFKTEEATKDVAGSVSSLVTEMDKFNEVQKEIILRAQGYQISDQKKKYDELTLSIEAQRKEIERLNEQNGKMRFVATGGGGTLSGAGQGTLVEIDNTKKLEEATRALNEAETAQLNIKKQIDELNDPNKLREQLDSMRSEIELIGLASKELYLKEAAQKGFVGWMAQEYVQLKINEEQRKAAVKADEEAKKAADDAAKKAVADEKSRAESIAKTIQGMEREIALYGVNSKAAQMEYDILNNILKVKGGLEGVEGRRLLTSAKTLDMLDAEKVAQEEYVSKLKDWVKGENDKASAVEKIIEGLEKQRAELGKNADAYLEMELRAKNATDEQIKYAVDLARANRDMEASIKSAEQMFERLDQVAANVWTDILTGSRSAWGGIKDLAISTIAEIAHEAYTKPIILRFQQQFMPSAGGMGGMAGMAGGGAGGAYALAAVAVIAGVNAWNKSQEEKFVKMTAEYRQGTQSMGTLLGMANSKSDSLNASISELEKYADDSLSVNKGMLQALIDIRTGIAGISAGFARTIDGMESLDLGQSGSGGGASLGAGAIGAGLGLGGAAASIGGLAGIGLASGGVGVFALGVAKLIGGDLGGFVEGILGSVGKALYSKKKKVIDSGIQFGATTLSDILTEGTIEAFAYADIKTTKKTLGIKTSTKVKTQQEELDDILLGQFADVFAGAGDALNQAAGIFGLDFQNYIDKLIIDPQKLSLKDLEGDALVKEIESFFSATLDNWAGVLTDGSNILEQFQEVGEGAFETVIRLASELNTFNQYVDLLDLDFSAVGFSAVEATQAIAEAAGGFDKLASSLGGYYQNFFSEEERATKQMESLTEAFKNLGIDQVPKTREAFRDLIEGLDLTTEADQKQFAALLGLQGVFAELVPLTEALTEVSRSEADIAAERLRLENELLQLQGNTGELRRRELEALHESNRGLQEHIWAIMDAKDAMSGLSSALDAEKARIQSIVSNAQNAKSLLDDAIAREKETLTSAHEERLKLLQDAAKAEQEANAESVRLQKEALKQQIDLTKDNISNLSGILKSLTGAISDIALESNELTRERRRAAQFEVDTMLRNAKAGRGLPEAGALDAALGVLKNNPTDLYATFAEMAYDTAVTQNKLTELAALTEGQLTAEQQRLALLEKQTLAADATVEMATKYDEQIAIENDRYQKAIAALDVEQENARLQLDKITGIDTSLLTLEQAQRAFQEAILAADFENAEEQYAQLEALRDAGQQQLNVLIGIESGIASVEQALDRFNSALQVEREKVSTVVTSKALSTTSEDMITELTQMREENIQLNNQIRLNTQETADILREMREEALAV